MSKLLIIYTPYSGGHTMNKHFLLRTLLSLFLAGTLCPTVMIAAHSSKGKTGPITYQEIGDSYISSFGMVTDNKPKINQIDDKNKKPDFTIPILTDQEKRQILFNLMNNAKPELSDNTLIENSVRVLLKDLDIYYGTGKDTKETLMSKINLTSTTFGEVVLAHLLAHPLKEVSLIQKRQSFIKSLVENDLYLQKVELLLNRLKKAESGFLSFWKDADPVTQDFLQKLYWSKLPTSLNKNPYAMEFAVRSGNLGTFMQSGGGLAVTLGVMILAAAAGEYFENKNLGHPVSYMEILKGYGKTAQLVTKMVSDKLTHLPTDPAERQKFYIAAGASSAYLAVLLGLQGYQTKVALSNAKQIKDGINYLQTRLIEVAAVVDVCKEFKNLAQEDSILSESIFSFASIDELLMSSDSSEFASLVKILQSNTFKGAASFFSLSGRVLAAYKLMLSQKEHFAPVLAAIGEIDACVSMAKLYKKMHHEHASYCFIDFVPTPKPYINLVGFWNPFIDPKLVVTNSLALGDGADASKIILTGSNTGGKSTILKAIITNLLLAHTFGIAAASKCVISPFAYLGSSLHINDDITSDESKFKAEVVRAKSLCQILESLQKNQFGFVVIDELFTGTNSINATDAAHKVAQKLAGLDNSLYILATHYPALTELEKEFPGIIKNYKVDVLKDDLGNLIRPFKLEPGISTSNVANDILNEEMQSIDFVF